MPPSTRSTRSTCSAWSSTWPSRRARAIASSLDLVKDAKAPVFLILNKIDLIKKSRLLPIIERYRQDGLFAEIIPVSAATGDNVDRLERAIIDRLPEGERLYPDDYLTDQPERFFAAEIVREKLLQFTHAEIPFSSAVVIDRFEEPARRAAAAALVLHDCRRPRVAEADRGRQGGDMIKRIGTAAREELERFFATRVFLDLHVRVKSEWREDDRVLATSDSGADSKWTSMSRCAVADACQVDSCTVACRECRSTPPTR